VAAQRRFELPVAGVADLGDREPDLLQLGTDHRDIVVRVLQLADAVLVALVADQERKPVVALGMRCCREAEDQRQEKGRGELSHATLLSPVMLIDAVRGRVRAPVGLMGSSSDRCR